MKRWIALLLLLATPSQAVVRNPVMFIGQKILGATNGAPLSADANGQLVSGITDGEASATGDTTTTSGSDVLMNAMTLTPVSGTYLVWCSTTLESSSNNAIITVSIYSGGAQITHTERAAVPFTNGGLLGGNIDLQIPIMTHAKTTVNGSQAIECRWRRSAGTATAHERTLDILRIN